MNFYRYLDVGRARVTAREETRNEKKEDRASTKIPERRETRAEAFLQEARARRSLRLALVLPFPVLSYVEERHGNGTESQRVPVC